MIDDVRHLVIGISVILALALNPLQALADDKRYELRPGDEIRVTVLKEPEMSGTFRVSMSGHVSVPGIGDIKGDGLTPSELRDLAIKTLAARHYTNPDVTIEVVKYGPVFVLGNVKTPGRQDYMPGLTALQLVAMAGGYSLSLGYDEGVSVRDLERQRENLAVLQEQYAAQSLRRARIIAERDGSMKIPRMTDLEAMIGKARLEQIEQAEMSLMQVRAEEAKKRTQLLLTQRAEIERGRVAIEEQLASTKRLKEIIEADLKSIKELRERGLTANTRVLDLERISADTEMRMNNALSLISRANQDRIAVDLQIRRNIELEQIALAEQLISAESELAVLRQRLGAAMAGLANAGFAVPAPSLSQSETTRRFSIMRQNNPEPLVAYESTEVRPGDVLVVISNNISLGAGLTSNPADQDQRTQLGGFPPIQK